MLANWGQEEKRVIEDEAVQCRHRPSGHEFEQTPGDSERQGNLACCSPRGPKELDMTQPLNNSWRLGWKAAFQMTLRNYSWEAWFYILLEQRILNNQGYISLKSKKGTTNRSACIQRVSMAVAPGKGLLSSKEYQQYLSGVPGREAFSFHFLTWPPLLLVSMSFSLIIKVDVPCMFDRLEAGSFN